MTMIVFAIFGLLFAAASTVLPLAGFCALTLGSFFEAVNITPGGLRIDPPLCLAALFLAACAARHSIARERVSFGAAEPALWLALAAAASVPLAFNPFGSALAFGGFAVRLGVFAMASHIVSTSRAGFPAKPVLATALFASAGIHMFQMAAGSAMGAAGGPFSGPDYFAFAAAASLPFLVPDSHAGEFERRAGNALAVSCVLLILAIGSVPGWALAFFAVFVGAYYRLTPPDVALGGLFILFMAVAIPLSGDFREAGGAWERFTRSGAVQERAESALFALGAAAESPITGVGAGQLNSYFEFRRGEAPPPANAPAASLTAIMAETGIWGGLAAVYLFVVVLGKLGGIRNPAAMGTQARRAAAAVWIAAAAGLVIDIHTHLFTWCLLGIAHGTALTGQTAPETANSTETA